MGTVSKMCQKDLFDSFGKLCTLKIIFYVNDYFKGLKKVHLM